jgi:hypothetical protein
MPRGISYVLRAEQLRKRVPKAHKNPKGTVRALEKLRYAEPKFHPGIEIFMRYYGVLYAPMKVRDICDEVGVNSIGLVVAMRTEVEKELRDKKWWK